MSLSISQKIESIRKEMRENGLSGYIIPTSDPHLSEYPAAHWKARAWISGFDGSFGTVVLTLKEAVLFTDSRYFLQATSQLKNTEITLVKMGLPDSPSFAEWLTEKLPEGSSVGIDPWVYAASDTFALEKALQKKGSSYILKPTSSLNYGKKGPNFLQIQFLFSRLNLADDLQKKRLTNFVQLLQKNAATICSFQLWMKLHGHLIFAGTM